MKVKNYSHLFTKVYEFNFQPNKFYLLREDFDIKLNFRPYFIIYCDLDMNIICKEIIDNREGMRLYNFTEIFKDDEVLDIEIFEEPWDRDEVF